MRMIVSYDVATTTGAGRSRLRRVAKLCKSYGVRVQYSIFECSVTDRELVILKPRLLALIKLDEDSLRFYFLGTEWRRRVEHVGAKLSYDPEAPLIL